MGKLAVIASALLILVVSGCASKRDWALVPAVEQNPYRIEAENITVAAECWTSDEDMRALFKKKPDGSIIAVRMLVYNMGEKTVRFSRTQARLALPDGTELPPVAPSELTGMLETNETAAGAIIIIMTGGYGGGIAHAIIESNARENWERQCAVRKCSMDLATIDAGQILTGFLFFRYPGRMPPPDKETPNLTLTINRMPRVSATPISCILQLPLFDRATNGRAEK